MEWSSDDDTARGSLIDSGIRGLGGFAMRLIGRARGLRAWLRDSRGVVAIIFGLSLLPIAVGAGMVVDLGRAYIVKSRLAYALDAAGLAVGSSSGTTDELQGVLENYFFANYPAGDLGVPAAPSMSIVGKEIHLSATADVNTAMMSIIGIDTIQVAVTSVVVRETTNIELALVLDYSFSMFGGKLAAVRTAATDLVDFLFQGDTVSDQVKIGIVPFSSTVNIGNANVGMLQVGPPSPPGYDATLYAPDSWRGCVEARPYPNDVSDTTMVVGGAWEPFLWQSNSLNDWATFGILNSPFELRGPNKNCPPALLPLTNDSTQITAKIDQLTSPISFSTLLTTGASWGWRVLSADPPFAEGAAYGTADNVKAIVLMTDGEQTWFNNGDEYTAYGKLSDGRLGTTDAATAESILNDRFLEICNGMSNNGILVYTIAFQVSGITIRNLLRDCATDPGKFYDATDSGALNQAFSAIAAELSNLRIGQ